MLTPPYATPAEALLPTTLTQVVRLRAPAHRIALTAVDISPLKNGSESEALSWFNPEEREQLSHYSFEKRKNEWLSGRLCAKQAVLKLLESQPGDEKLQAHDITIKNNKSGRPFVHFNGSCKERPEEIDISISHSHGKAVGIAGLGLCGIDIQYLNNTLYNVKQRYCSTVEAAIVDMIPADELVQLGLLWVAKEAVRKCLSGLRLAGFQEMQLERVSEERGHYVLDLQLDSSFPEISPITVVTHHVDSYTIAVCTLDRERLHA